MNKKIIRLALVTAFLLLIPFVAMQFTDEVNWDLFDFAFMGMLIFGTGLAYELLTRKMTNKIYEVVVGIALVAVFLVVWGALAVGI